MIFFSFGSHSQFCTKSKLKTFKSFQSSEWPVNQSLYHMKGLRFCLWSLFFLQLPSFFLSFFPPIPHSFCSANRFQFHEVTWTIIFSSFFSVHSTSFHLIVSFDRLISLRVTVFSFDFCLINDLIESDFSSFFSLRSTWLFRLIDSFHSVLLFFRSIFVWSTIWLSLTLWVVWFSCF